MYGHMYQPASTCGDHDVLYFVLLWITTSALVGLAVCVCSQIIQIYACTLISGDELLIAGLYLYLSFLAVFICPTIGGGSLYLRCTVAV